MTEASRWLADYWFSLLTLLLALAFGFMAMREKARTKAWLPLACGFGLFGLGGLLVPSEWGLVAAACLGGLVLIMAVVLLWRGAWSARLGWLAGAGLSGALGSLSRGVVELGLAEATRTARSMELSRPLWLLLLLVLPWIVWVSYRSLAGLGPFRRWLAIGLRSLLVILLTLALAELQLRRQAENITVFFVVDRSLSIPEEFDAGTTPDSTRVDRRWERIEQFINSAVEQRGPKHSSDKTGLILFGRRPRLEFPATNAPAFQFRLRESASVIDGTYTDIAAALKLAFASFPEGTGKRIILLSDGNENLGNALEQARVAVQNGVQIDVVPLAAGYRNENEVLVQAVEAPPRTEQGARLPIRVLIRSHNPRPVAGTLTVRQVSEGDISLVAPSPMRIQLKPGLNVVSFKQPLANEQRSYTYQAIFQPEAVQGTSGEWSPGLPGDRVQNNSATTHVVALGQRRILLIEQRAGEQQLLVDRLKTVGNAKYRVHAITVDQLPQNKAELAIFLSNYDSVILANVAASDVAAGVVADGRQEGVITEEQQEILRSNTHDQGCGLIMIGGPSSFGAGGWKGTPVEAALPVDCEIRSLKVMGKSGLALIMHASEMSDGNRWQKEIAKLAIQKLSPYDELGVIHYDWGKYVWHIPLQVVGGKKPALLGLVDRMSPGDMPDFDVPLQMAYDSLSEPRRQLATKHVIVISDGDPILANPGLLTKMKNDRVSVTTVGVATHGSSQDAALMQIAQKTGGRFYKVTNPKALPSIYTKETRLISQSLLFEQRFSPQLLFRSGPTDKLPDTLPPLYGYVRTTLKQSPLVEMSIMAPKVGEQEFPILAYWTYGLGKAVAFTSDARSQPSRPAWDRDWASSDIYGKFWEQVLDYSLRPTETGRLLMTTEYSDGKVRVQIDARDDKNRPLTDLTLQGAVTTPSSRADQPSKFELRFEQKNSGVYEAEFKAEEAGSYFISAQSRRPVKKMEKGKEVVQQEQDSVRVGVTVPYSPEFADVESNVALLGRIRDLTGGKSFKEEDLAALVPPTSTRERAAMAQEVFRPGLPQFKELQSMWYWLVLAACICLFFDVANRRIAVQPAEVAVAAERIWHYLRHRSAPALATPQFIDRLKSRKQSVVESIDEKRSARRFDDEGMEPSAPIHVAAERGPATPAPPRPRSLPESPADAPAEDYASRLMKAKKKVWEEREKPEENS